MNGEWGMRTPVTRSGRGGEPLAKSTLYRLFSNVFYAGCFVHDGILYKGAHPPMVRLDEFDRAQKIIGKDNPLKPRTSHAVVHRPDPLRASGGGQVTADVRTKPSGRTYTYYHCQGKNGCRRRFLRQDRLEALLDAELAQMDLLPEFYDWAIQDIERASAKEQAERQAVYDQQLRALREADGMLDSLLGMRLRDLISDEEYAAKRNTLTLDRERLHQTVQECEAGGDRAREVCLNAAEYMKNARAWLRHGDPAMKRIVGLQPGIKLRVDGRKVGPGAASDAGAGERGLPGIGGGIRGDQTRRKWLWKQQKRRFRVGSCHLERDMGEKSYDGIGKQPVFPQAYAVRGSEFVPIVQRGGMISMGGVCVPIQTRSKQ